MRIIPGIIGTSKQREEIFNHTRNTEIGTRNESVVLYA